MRKELVRALRQEFRRHIESTGRFRHVNHSDGAPGSDIYVAPISPNLNGFVYLIPNQKLRDEFMIELAWSGDAAFPSRARLQHSRALDPSVDGRIRLPNLWREEWPSALEPWWDLGTASVLEMGDAYYTEDETRRRLARVPEVVTDAIDRLNRYGAPFLERVARERRQNA